MQPEHSSVEDLLDVAREDGRGTGAHRAPAGTEPVPVPDPAAAPDPAAGDPSGRVAGPDPETVPEPVAGPVADAVTAERLDRIDAALVETNRLLGESGERAAARERVIDRQHTEIERLKAVERVGTMRPVVLELCRLRNDLLRRARTLPPDMSVDRFAVLLDSFAGSVAEALEACGVEALPLAPGASFVPQQHRASSVTGTTDPGRDGVVAEVVADGYVETDGGKVVTPARVVLYRLDPAPENPAGTGSPPETGVPHAATTPVPTTPVPTSEESTR